LTRNIKFNIRLQSISSSTMSFFIMWVCVFIAVAAAVTTIYTSDTAPATITAPTIIFGPVVMPVGIAQFSVIGGNRVDGTVPVIAFTADGTLAGTYALSGMVANVGSRSGSISSGNFVNGSTSSSLAFNTIGQIAVTTAGNLTLTAVSPASFTMTELLKVFSITHAPNGCT
jgi:hypothetical protein